MTRIFHVSIRAGDKKYEATWISERKLTREEAQKEIADFFAGRDVDVTVVELGQRPDV